MTLAAQKQLRHVFEVISGATPATGNVAYWDGDILWATPEDVSSLDGYRLRDTRRKITRAGHESCGTTMAPPDSVLLTKRAPIGQVAILAREACSNQGCFLLIPRGEIDTRFYYYWFSVHTAYLQVLGCGSTFMELGIDDLKSLDVPYPPLVQQRAIAAYLDRETARLDALVATKERLLDLLAEKRRALITRAVTCGLDPRVPFRDSGIPWLGQIPKHWHVWKLGHIGSVGNGSTPNRDNPAYWTEGTIPWLNSSVVNQHEVEKAEQFVTELALRERHLPLVKSGSVLVAITGQGKTRGQAVVLSLDATINQHLAYISPDQSCLAPWFLRWTLLAAYGFLRSISDDAGGTKGALTCEDVHNLRIPIPPIDEQHAIVAYIASETSKLAELRAATERTAALLKERRTALISAAVTGQTDVEEKDELRQALVAEQRGLCCYTRVRGCPDQSD